MTLLQKINIFITGYLVSFFELQFVISIMSLPLLISWGIPISIMGPLANFIFTPLLVLFLWCSCMASICILTNLPATIFEFGLNSITHLWLHVLSYSRPSWLIAFPHNMLWLSIAFCLLIVMLYTYIKPTAKKSTLLLCLTWCTMIALRPYFIHKNGIKKIGTLPLWLAYIHDKTYLIDHGALCNRKNMFTNIDYTVLPELIRHTGHSTVDTVMFCKPSSKIAKVAAQCCKQLNCSTIMITQKANCFCKAQKQLQDNKINIIALNKKTKVPHKNHQAAGGAAAA